MGVASGTPRDRHGPADWRRGLMVFLALLAIYHANAGHIAAIDCYPAAYSAWALVRHGSLDLTRYEELRAAAEFTVQRLADGRHISAYPPGSTFAALPFVAPFALFREQPFGLEGMLLLGKSIAAIYTAGAGAVFHALCQRIVPAAAWAATILFGLGTNLWSVASQGLWMHGPATFWLVVALYWLLVPGPRDDAGRAVRLGIVLGLAAITRNSTILFVAASAITLWAGQGSPGAAIRMSLAAAAPVGFLLAWNQLMFGHPITGGYGPAGSFPWGTPLHVGVVGLLICPSRGLLVYSPALVLVAGGLWRCGARPALDRGARWGVITWFLAAVGSLLVYARFSTWWGGWVFGPRYLCECLPVLCLLFALQYAHWSGSSLRWLAWALVALSVVVHCLGVFGQPNDWNARRWNLSAPDVFLSLRDTQIEAHIRTLLGLPAAAGH